MRNPLIAGCVFHLAVALFLLPEKPLLAESSSLLNQLVERSKAELAKKDGKVAIALEWVNPKQGKRVVEEFRREFPFIREVAYQTLGSSANERHQRMLMEYKVGHLPDFDIMPTSSEV